MKKIYFLTVVAICAIGCCNQVKIEGAWGESSPCPTKKVQGIVLEEGGLAKAINIKGVSFESWQKEGDLLILKGFRMPCPKHQCPKQCTDSTVTDTLEVLPDSLPMPEPIAFIDTLKIQKLTADSLVLVTPCGHVFNYARFQCEKAKCCFGDKCMCCKKCDKKQNCCKETVTCNKANCCKKDSCRKESCDKVACEKKCKQPSACGEK